MFYLRGQLYELNLGTFNGIYGFPPCMDLPNRQAPHEFNQIHFGASFQGVLGIALVHRSAHILGTLALE